MSALTLQLSLLRPCPGDPRIRWIRVSTHNTRAHVILHVPAPNMKCKGFNWVIRKSLASELLSTHRAARIPSLENIDS